MTIMSPALARGAAQLDFQRGCMLEDNPYPVASDAYLEWENEMRRLLDREAQEESQMDFWDESMYEDMDLYL